MYRYNNMYTMGVCRGGLTPAGGSAHARNDRGCNYADKVRPCIRRSTGPELQTKKNISVGREKKTGQNDETIIAIWHNV